MLLIGLTGGIGSGKSTVADCFSRLGIPVIDADQIARVLVQPGSPALEAITHAFGDGILADDGQLNRSTLRRWVFSDDHKRRQLEEILHPRIRRRLLEQAAQQHSPYVILVIPLLFESGFQDMVHRILVVDVPEELQRHRAANRDKTDAAEIQRIMASQHPREQRLQGADDVIDNSQGPEQLQAQVEKLHRHYLELAKQFQRDLPDNPY